MLAAAIGLLIIGALFEFAGIVLVAVDTGRKPRANLSKRESAPSTTTGSTLWRLALPSGSDRSVEARLALIEDALVSLPEEIRREAGAASTAVRRHGVRVRGWSVGLLLTGILLLAAGNVLGLAA